MGVYMYMYVYVYMSLCAPCLTGLIFITQQLDTLLKLF